VVDGNFEFRPQSRVRGPQIWKAKILLVPISPPILDSWSRKFLDPWGFRRHNISPNFNLLVPPICLANVKIWWPWVVPWVREGRLKLPILKNLACLAPPSGVMRQRTLTFRLIWIQRLVFSYGSKNQNSRFYSFWSMGNQSWKKSRKLRHAVSAQKYSKSTPAHIRTDRRSRRRPHITIEVE